MFKLSILGCVSKSGTAAYSCKKNANTTNVDEREKPRCELIEPGGNPSIFLQLVEEAFHQMSLLVQRPVAVPRINGI